jgi:hypothetical protein
MFGSGYSSVWGAEQLLDYTAPNDLVLTPIGDR